MPESPFSYSEFKDSIYMNLYMQRWLFSFALFLLSEGFSAGVVMRKSEYSDRNVGKTNLSFIRWNQRTQPFSLFLCLQEERVGLAVLSPGPLKPGTPGHSV